MKINYNLTGQERKSLVGAISQELNAPTKYLGAPTFAYEVSEYHIDKNGVVTGKDNSGLVADLCGLHDFKAVSEEYDEPMTYEESLGEIGELETFYDLKMDEREELGLGKQRHEDPQGENGMQVNDIPEAYDPDQLVIEISMTGFTPEKLDNLYKLVNAKSPLLKAALGTDDLPIQQTDYTLMFLWFSGELDGDTVKAYATLIEKICTAAKEKHRVTAKEHNVANQKYAMRCWLLSLGFIGDEYKTDRKILLKNLDGNSSYKSGVKKDMVV